MITVVCTYVLNKNCPRNHISSLKLSLTEQLANTAGKQIC